jgi:hypothetical protein
LHRKRDEYVKRESEGEREERDFEERVCRTINDQIRKKKEK